MSEYRLTSKAEANAILAAHFKSRLTTTSTLAIREDKCFKNEGWLDLGKIKLNPGQSEPGEEESDRLLAAVTLGFFEWECSNTTDVHRQLFDLLEATKDEHKGRAKRALDAVACVATRIGLIHPLFDADAIAHVALH